MSNLFPSHPPGQGPHPTHYPPPEDGTGTPETRPGAVTAVVVISYVQTGVSLLGALGFLALGLGLEAILIAAIGILIAVLGNRLGKGSRGWRTAYLVFTAIGVVVAVLDIGRQASSLVAAAIGILSIVLLLLPRSRAWFGTAS